MDCWCKACSFLISSYTVSRRLKAEWLISHSMHPTPDRLWIYLPIILAIINM